ncbi:MAG: GGDEF domain-containing protein [Peptococcaceae bacterium]|nr:GGDEF domain-containing protein [Peptococcaceae bacterium]
MTGQRRRNRRNIRGTAEKMAPLSLPLGLLIAAHLLSAGTVEITPALYPLIGFLPHFVFALGLFLSYWFNNSRVFFSALAASLGYLALAASPQGWFGTRFSKDVIYFAVCLLLPVSLLVFSRVGEKGVFTSRGRVRFVFIAVQAFLALWAAGGGPRWLAGLFKADILPLSPPSPIPGIAIAAFLVSFLAFAGRLMLTGSPAEGWFAGALVSLALALHRGGELSPGVFFSAAGVMLTSAVIQDSYRKAYLDELTGLPGRRALREEMAKLDGRYTIAMLDIDYFKKFNDTFGHDVGDEVLKFVASLIGGVSGGGKAFRYGGEEFTILFPGRRLNQVVPHLEELREAIARRPFTIRGKDRPKNKPDRIRPGSGSSTKVQITVSIGAAERTGRLNTAEEVIRAADEALYRAKENGRNRVSV